MEEILGLLFISAQDEGRGSTECDFPRRRGTAFDGSTPVANFDLHKECAVCSTVDERIARAVNETGLHDLDTTTSHVQ